MASKKIYSSPELYEDKLVRVMARLGIEEGDYNYDWSRQECWVEFRYKGELYRFSHSVKNAQEHGISLQYGSDAFAQVVLSLEDLARMVERGIYDLSTWVAGMKALQAFRCLLYCSRFRRASHIQGRNHTPLPPVGEGVSP